MHSGHNIETTSIQRQFNAKNDFVSTLCIFVSMSTLNRCCFNVVCQLGRAFRGTLSREMFLSNVFTFRLKTGSSQIKKNLLQNYRRPLFRVVLVCIITKTRLHNFDPLKPHLYTVKLGSTGVYINFYISAQKHKLWVLVRTASARRF